MENRKTSIIIYPADFLASVHNFKKSEIANLIVAICEFNLFGATSVKLSELNKKRFDAIQQVIANHNEKWRQTCEINAQNAKRAVSRRKANAKRTVSEVIEFPSTGRQQEKESENEKESDKVNDKDCRERETAFVDNLSYIGAPVIVMKSELRSTYRLSSVGTMSAVGSMARSALRVTGRRLFGNGIAKITIFPCMNLKLRS